MNEENPQGIASDDEKDASYLAALKRELASAQASLKGAERYGDDAKAKIEQGHILDIEEEIAKIEGASPDEAAAPKKAAAKKDDGASDA